MKRGHWLWVIWLPFCRLLKLGLWLWLWFILFRASLIYLLRLLYSCLFSAKYFLISFLSSIFWRLLYLNRIFRDGGSRKKNIRDYIRHWLFFPRYFLFKLSGLSTLDLWDFDYSLENSIQPLFSNLSTSLLLLISWHAELL